MELNTLLQYKPYSTARPEKRALYAGLLTELTQFHRERCPEYGRLLDALGCPAHMDCTVESTPMLPVWMPERILETGASIGNVLTGLEINNALVAERVVILKEYPFIGVMGYAAGENPFSYPELQSNMM